MNTAQSADPALVLLPADHFRAGEQPDSACSTGGLGTCDPGVDDRCELAPDDLPAGLTESATTDADGGLQAYFLVLLAITLVAAYTLLSPLTVNKVSGTRGRRSHRPLQRSQWMLDPCPRLRITNQPAA